MNLLTVSGISKLQEDFVLKGVSFTQQKSQKIAVAGETGSGKSTLLKIIAGLIQPDAGEVLFKQERVLGPEEKLLPGHPEIAYLSQHFELRNNYSVKEVLSMANKFLYDEAVTIYEVCRVNHLLNRRTDQISGGEKQRIALARLLISSPKLLLLDEPFSNLDMGHKNMLKSVISDISERLKITSILISHDPLDILSWADEIIVIKNGKIIQKGSPEQIYNQPVNEYTAGLFGKYNLIKAEQAHAFNKLFRIDLNGKNMLLRPEHFKIATEDSEAAIKAIVCEVKFFGGYYEIDVFFSGSMITVKTESCTFKGDRVYLSLLKNNVWYV